MRLLVHSYFPIYKSHQAGGAQFALSQIIRGLAQLGFDITIICPQVESPNQLLQTDKIICKPCLKEKRNKDLILQDRLENLKHISMAVQGCDVVWTLDAQFPLPVEQPIVLSLQTVAYEDELDSLLHFNWDTVIAASPYLESLLRVVMNQLYKNETSPPVQLITNGIDFDLFLPCDSKQLIKRLNLPKGKYILFPHRPEAAKGFTMALAILKHLVEYNPEYKLLVPTHPKSVKYCLDKEKKFYRGLFSTVARKGLSSSVVFHPWIHLEELPSYYSLGEWCLVLSKLPEGFGFTPVQSIACGTPVLSTKSGSLREKFPLGYGVDYINLGNVKEAVQIILEDQGKHNVWRGLEFAKEHYPIRKCVEKYSHCFLNVQKHQKRAFNRTIHNAIKFSPWCYQIDKKTIWHDLKMKKIRLTKQQAAIVHDALVGPLPIDSIERDVYKNDCQGLIDQGVLLTCNASLT